MTQKVLDDSNLHRNLLAKTTSGRRKSKSPPIPNSPRVVILLGTHNGSAFLGEQIASIQNQSYSEWELWIRDDRSADETPYLLDRFTGEDSRVRRLPDADQRRGAAGNYGDLLAKARDAKADYVFLADQDDVWRPDKIVRTLQVMADVESNVGADVPVLVHADLAVTDEKLQVRHPSFMSYQRIRHQRDGLRTLLVQNFVTGCTCCVNRSLLDLACPLPEDAVMHDWWLALCAAGAGVIEFLPEPHVLYRQHGKNEVGAMGFWTTLNLFRKSWRIASRASLREFLDTVSQSRAFRARVLERRHLFSATTIQFVEEYCLLFEPHVGNLERVSGIRRLGVRRQDMVRNLLLTFRLATISAN
ncbi:MAG: glycosyltransferase family 2 protein [Planctomycetota bacterium]